MTISAIGIATPRLLLDAREYAQQVLLQGGDMPWEPTAHAQLLGQVGALLRPDLTLVDLGAFLATALERRPDLTDRIGGARRGTAALRALLADDALAQGAVELVRVVAAMSRLPVAVQIPSPGAWLSELAGRTRNPEIDGDDAENASVYVADWIRRFSALPLDTLLLDGRGAGFEESLSAYGPLVGLAEHYRWTLALRRADTLELSAGVGEVLDPTFWAGRVVDLPRRVDLVLGRIDPHASPETVLEARGRWGEGQAAGHPRQRGEEKGTP